MTSVESLQGATLYLDSNVFIYALEAEEGPQRRAATGALDAVHTGQCTAATSIVSRTEVLVRPLRLKQTVLADRYRALLSGRGAVALYAVDEDVVDLAAALRADYPALRLPDALHVATALRAGCNVFVTGDRRLAAVSSRVSTITLDQLIGA